MGAGALLPPSISLLRFVAVVCTAHIYTRARVEGGKCYSVVNDGVFVDSYLQTSVCLPCQSNEAHLKVADKVKVMQVRLVRTPSLPQCTGSKKITGWSSYPMQRSA